MTDEDQQSGPSNSRKRRGISWPIFFGWALTGLVVLVAILLLLQEVPGQSFGPFRIGPDQSRWSLLMSDPLNEIGDSLAGFAGALAFIWLLVTVMIQISALKVQQRELMDTRKATASQAKALEFQASIFQDEKQKRDEDQQRKLLDQYLISLKNHIEDVAENCPGLGTDEILFPMKRDCSDESYSSMEFQEYFRYRNDQATNLSHIFCGEIPGTNVINDEYSKGKIRQVQEICKKIKSINGLSLSDEEYRKRTTSDILDAFELAEFFI